MGGEGAGHRGRRPGGHVGGTPGRMEPRRPILDISRYSCILVSHVLSNNDSQSKACLPDSYISPSFGRLPWSPRGM